MVKAESDAPPDLEIHHIPQKGLGVIAHSWIPPGSIIVEEEPMISLPLNADGSLDGSFRRVDLRNEGFYSPFLEEALRHLPRETRALFHSLADSTTAHGKSNFGIMKTNSFAVSLNSRIYLGLFPNVARINHACNPNCHHYWTTKTGKYTVRSVKEIKPGEEITISYMSPLQRVDFHRRDLRREILKEEFDFVCECPSCTTNWDPSDDERRYAVQDIEKNWKSYASDPELALKQAERQWELAVKLDFHCGILSYICLHAVEASTILMESNGASKGADIYQRAKDSAYYFSDQGLSSGELAYGRESSEYRIFKGIYDEVRLDKSPSMISKAIRRYLNNLKSN